MLSHTSILSPVPVTIIRIYALLVMANNPWTRSSTYSILLHSSARWLNSVVFIYSLYSIVDPMSFPVDLFVFGLMLFVASWFLFLWACRKKKWTHYHHRHFLPLPRARSSALSLSKSTTRTGQESRNLPVLLYPAEFQTGVHPRGTPSPTNPVAKSDPKRVACICFSPELNCTQGQLYHYQTNPGGAVPVVRVIIAACPAKEYISFVVHRSEEAEKYTRSYRHTRCDVC